MRDPAMLGLDSSFPPLPATSRRVIRLRRRAGKPDASPPEPQPDATEELGAAHEELQVAQEELRQQNEELLTARESVEAERQRYKELFEFAPDGYLVTTPDGVIREANRIAAALLNIPAHFLAGKPLVNFLRAEQRRPFRSELDRLRQVDRLQIWTARFCPRHRDPFEAALTAAAVRDREGRLTGVRWLLRDVTDLRRAEEQVRALNAELEQRVRERTAQLEAANRAQEELLLREQEARAAAEAAQQRLIFLAGASSLLSASLDYPATLARLPHLVVPHLADACAIDLLEEDGTLRRISSPPPRSHTPTPRIPPPSPRVLQTREPDYVPEIAGSDREAPADDPERLRQLREEEFASYICVPLAGAGRTLGALSFVTAESGRRFSSIDLAVAEDLARRAAAAMENALLYRRVCEADRRKK